MNVASLAGIPRNVKTICFFLKNNFIFFQIVNTAEEVALQFEQSSKQLLER
jgi:hypothetical protein